MSTRLSASYFIQVLFSYLYSLLVVLQTIRNTFFCIFFFLRFLLLLTKRQLQHAIQFWHGGINDYGTYCWMLKRHQPHNNIAANEKANSHNIVETSVWACNEQHYWRQYNCRTFSIKLRYVSRLTVGIFFFLTSDCFILVVKKWCVYPENTKRVLTPGQWHTILQFLYSL